MIAWYPATTPPEGWLECNGQTTASHPALAAVVGSNVPDLRGVFIRGWSHGNYIDSGRSFRSYQDWAIENIYGTFHWYKGVEGNFLATGAFYQTGITETIDTFGHISNGAPHAYIGGFDASRVVKTSSETRPANVSLLPCIKY